MRDALGSEGAFPVLLSAGGDLLAMEGICRGLWLGLGALLVRNPLPSSSGASSQHRMVFASGVSSSNSWILGVKWGRVNGFWLFMERFVGSDVALSWSCFVCGFVWGCVWFASGSAPSGITHLPQLG